MLDAGCWILGVRFDEGIDFGGSGGEAGEVEGEAADEDFGSGGGRGCEVVGFELGEDEAVDFVFGPRLVFYGG